MIFNKELDKSLWLILESDKKNRDRIKCFVESIPNDLYQQIYNKLDEYSEYEKGHLNMFDLDDFFLKGECLGYLNKKYSFVIDIVGNSLSITESMLINGKFKDLIELTLFMGSRYNSVEISGRQSIGSFTNYVTKNVVNYDLINTLLGLMIEYSNYDYRKCADGFKKYKRINTNLIVDELNLSSKEGITRVRKMN